MSKGSNITLRQICLRSEQKSKLKRDFGIEYVYIYLMQTHFEHLGFTRDFYVGDRYIGTIPCQYDTNSPLGYASRQDLVAESDMRIGKRKIQRGTPYWTITNQLCGKYIGPAIREIQSDHNSLKA